MSVLSSLFAMAGDAVAPAAQAAVEAAPNPALARFTEMAQATTPWSTAGNFWMPEAASVTADGGDWMFYAVLGLSIFCFVGILFATVYFVVRYRHRDGHTAEPSIAHNDKLEITWTIIPTIICVFLFMFGWREYLKLSTPPQHALQVQVYASQWNWHFTHDNGVEDDNALYVPVDTPVRLVMTAQDVLHSFWVPAFRIKQDVVPRRYTHLWFQATKPGIYRINCAEFCGAAPSSKVGDRAGHAQMVGRVIVLSQGDFDEYMKLRYEQSSQMSPAQLGESVYVGRCKSCHSIDGTRVVGPTWKGIFGNPVELDDGTTGTVDEDYLRESIVEPLKKSRATYPKGAMTSFAGLLSDKEINGLIEYIKSLK